MVAVARKESSHVILNFSVDFVCVISVCIAFLFISN